MNYGDLVATAFISGLRCRLRNCGKGGASFIHNGGSIALRLASQFGRMVMTNRDKLSDFDRRVASGGILFLKDLLGACLPAPVLLFAQSSAIISDGAPDKANPAAMQSLQIPSRGALLNAFVYIAAGAGPHPIVLLLHGLPGNERNLDLAQSARRAGWDIVYFDYRGSWGSPGAFSFIHCIEDAQSALAFLRDPTVAAKFRADPKAIVLVGHSTGGFVPLQVGALDPNIKAIITISAVDLGTSRVQSVRSTSTSS
jgi:acetyl esterase/lipase